MTATVDRPYQLTLHPIHAVFLAGTIPLFLGAALSDIAYAYSYQIQWSNFSSWLIAGGLVFAGLAIVAALLGLTHAEGRGRRGGIYLALLLATWGLGFINALVHAKDAWAMMPMGLILSVIVTVIACAATGVRFSGRRVGGAH